MSTPLAKVADIKVNANHLKNVDEPTLTAVLNDVHILFIDDYAIKWADEPSKIAKLTVIEKLLAQHMATLNVRRADSESVAGMAKSVSVAKDQDLNQTEYGQMARKMAGKLGMDWANEDQPASLVIF